MYVPGDFGLERASNADGSTPSKVSQLIMAGERSRFGDTSFALWSHSFLIVSTDGRIVEANEGGIEERDIREYAGRDVVIVDTQASRAQRALAVQFARRQVGEAYGILDFVSLALQAILGWNLSISVNQQMICSELVARATEKYIDAYPLPAQSMMPADLAHYWGKADPEKPPPLGWFGKLLNLLLLPRELLR
jgi:uncharacterized protein YycO